MNTASALGYAFDIDAVRNSKVRRILRAEASQLIACWFSDSGHTDHHDRYKEYSDHRDHREHKDYYGDEHTGDGVN